MTFKWCSEESTESRLWRRANRMANTLLLSKYTSMWSQPKSLTQPGIGIFVCIILISHVIYLLFIGCRCSYFNYKPWLKLHPVYIFESHQFILLSNSHKLRRLTIQNANFYFDDAFLPFILYYFEEYITYNIALDSVSYK